MTNLGSSEPAVFHGNVITPRSDGPRILYAGPGGADAEPSVRSKETSNSAFRCIVTLASTLTNAAGRRVGIAR